MKTILTLTDFSKKSNRSAEYAMYFAMPTKADILLFHACNIPSAALVQSGRFQIYEDDVEDVEKDSIKKLTELANHLKRTFEIKADGQMPQIRCQSWIGSITDSIEGVIKQKPIWMIIMSDTSNHDFFSHLLISSEANLVVRKANCPVLIIPERLSFSPLKKITFVSAIFDPEEQKALSFIIQLATSFNAEISVINVLQSKTLDEETQHYMHYFKTAGSKINYDKITFYDVNDDDGMLPVHKFARLIKSDMVALVHRKYPFFQYLIHESITMNLMDYENVPMLVFPDMCQ